MSDADLIAWMVAGSPVALSDAESAARRTSDFSQRFLTAIRPEGDLGATQELHDMAVAESVFEIHEELNALGEEAYMAVWWTFDAPTRRAIKKLVEMAFARERPGVEGRLAVYEQFNRLPG